jgi:hypothetical protein
MPLIKDKDRYKKLSRIDAKQTEQPKEPVNRVINKTLRDRQEASDNIKSEAILDSLNLQNSSPELAFSKPAADTVTNIVTLQPGESLVNLVLCSISGAIIDLHWSFDSPEDLTFTNSSGVITAVTGGETVRIVAYTISAKETVSLSHILSTMVVNRRMLVDETEPQNGLFSNISNPIYFYYVANAATVDITYAIV